VLYFVGVTTKHPIECKKYDHRPGKSVSSRALTSFSNSEIHFPASELPETGQVREPLESMNMVLEDGQGMVCITRGHGI
jgi:hypothetical protein